MCLNGWPPGRQLLQFRAAALGEDGMAGIAVVGLDGLFAVVGLVRAVMAAETAGPEHVAEVVRIHAPVGLHFRKEIVRVNPLQRGDGRFDARIVGIPFRQRGGDAGLAPRRRSYICGSGHKPRWS